jgi:type III pantothenate kinase
MNLLLVDLGNTRVKWALARPGGKPRLLGDRPTAQISGAWVRTLAAKHAGHRLVLASVVPKWTAVFIRAFRGRATLVSGALPALKPLFHYPKPAELGADRIAAAAAAQADGLFPAIIVACGTATAFTVLDAKGRLCGGAIAPGLQAQLNALLGATAQLPATSLRLPRTALAKSTRDAIRAGIVLGYRGGIREIIAQLTQALPSRPRPRVILTGGDAARAVPALSGRVTLRPLLVLEGLRIIGARLEKAVE